VSCHAVKIYRPILENSLHAPRNTADSAGNVANRRGETIPSPSTGLKAATGAAAMSINPSSLFPATQMPCATFWLIMRRLWSFSPMKRPRPMFACLLYAQIFVHMRALPFSHLLANFCTMCNALTSLLCFTTPKGKWHVQPVRDIVQCRRVKDVDIMQNNLFVRFSRLGERRSYASMSRAIPDDEDGTDLGFVTSITCRSGTGIDCGIFLLVCVMIVRVRKDLAAAFMYKVQHAMSPLPAFAAKWLVPVAAK
jgi:hypothetical protein